MGRLALCVDTAAFASATGVLACATFCRGCGLYTGGATGRLTLCADTAVFGCATMDFS